MLLGICLLDIYTCQKQGHMENDVLKRIKKKTKTKTGTNTTSSFA